MERTFGEQAPPHSRTWVLTRPRRFQGALLISGEAIAAAGGDRALEGLGEGGSTGSMSESHLPDAKTEARGPEPPAGTSPGPSGPEAGPPLRLPLRPVGGAPAPVPAPTCPLTKAKAQLTQLLTAHCPPGDRGHRARGPAPPPRPPPKAQLWPRFPEGLGDEGSQSGRAARAGSVGAPSVAAVPLGPQGPKETAPSVCFPLGIPREGGGQGSRWGKPCFL